LSDGTNSYLYGLGRIGKYQSVWAYYLPDGLDSVRQITDHAANLTLLQSYEPYGSVMSYEGIATSNYGFANEWTDATGLQHLRARYYDTRVGRFINRDVWGGDYNNPMSLNRWMYVEGNPVNWTDPSGMTPITSGNRGAYFYSPLVEFKSGDVAKKIGGDPWMFAIQDMRLIEKAMWDIARRYAEAYADATVDNRFGRCLPPEIRRYVKIAKRGIDPQTAFLRIHGGKITIYTMREFPGYHGEVLSRNSMYIYYGGSTEMKEERGEDKKPTNLYSWLVYYNEYTNTTHRITTEFMNEAFKRFIVREVGHMFDQAVYDVLGSENWPRNAVNDRPDLRTGQGPFNLNGFYGTKRAGWQWRLETSPWHNAIEEIFADQFIGWVYDKWEVEDERFGTLTLLGQSRKDFMDENMAFWITEIIGYNHHRR